MTSVTILGSGNMARGIATRALAGGSSVQLLDRDPVADLARDGGMRPVDAGPLRRARQLEQAGFLHMALQEPLGTGYASALRFVG